MKLLMMKVGATLPGRLIEQHDVFFGIADQVQDLIPELEAAWPEAAGHWHLDCWREINSVGTHRIRVVPKSASASAAHATQPQLFFLNLGGYRPGVFEEFHHKILVVAMNTKEAIAQAKNTTFYREYGFPGAVSHIDDQYGVAIDDVCRIQDALPERHKQQYTLDITADPAVQPDALHIGYISRKKLLEQTTP